MGRIAIPLVADKSKPKLSYLLACISCCISCSQAVQLLIPEDGHDLLELEFSAQSCSSYSLEGTVRVHVISSV